MSLSLRLEQLLKDLSHFPWRTTALTLRQRFRELLRDEIGATVSDDSEIDDEIAYLISVLTE